MKSSHRNIDYLGIPVFIQQWPHQKHEGHPVAAPYGFIKGTRHQGADDMAIDCFLGPSRTSRKVFLIDVVDAHGHFKQIKCFLGFVGPRQVENVFERTYHDDNAHHLGNIVAMDIMTFKSWLAAGGGRHPVHPNTPRAAKVDHYQAGGAVESTAEQPTPASYYGDYLEAARHLFGGNQAINDLMRHFGGAVSGSSSA
jgi:hypothetical protein